MTSNKRQLKDNTGVGQKLFLSPHTPRGVNTVIEEQAYSKDKTLFHS